MRLSDAALDAFRAVLGEAHVLTDPLTRTRAETATFATHQRVPAVIRPANADEVAGCLAVAVQHAVLVYPISAGRNWGFGSRVPTQDGCVVMDLSRMKRIVDFDEDMAWVTVEPGVTFRALYDFLRARGSRLFASTTGSSPEASVIGNVMERGDGSGPKGDRWQHVCALEVLLSTGERIRTGFGRYGMEVLAPLHLGGLGPALDGLFSQSNLGVVTQMTLWLTPLPRSIQVVRFGVTADNSLPSIIEALRWLRMDGTLRCAVGIWNDYRALSTRQQYPWEHTKGRTPLQPADMDTLRSQWGGARWFGTTALYAPSKDVGTALREHLVSVLAHRVDTWSVEERSGDATSGHELLVANDPAFLFVQGIPHEESLRSVYWRKRTIPAHDLDPDRDHCGVLWISVALPFRGTDLLRAVTLIEPLCLAHGFEPMLACVAQSERAMYLVPAIVYDRDVPGEDQRAMALHDLLLKECIAAGFPPYRLGVQSMGMAPAATDDSAAVLHRLKTALDPAGIISPGRYEVR